MIDTETKLYYLQSRYYDPEICRFLNADGTLNGNGDLLGFNMFAYCSNNPVMYSDPSGCGLKSVFNYLKRKAKEIYNELNKINKKLKTQGKTKKRSNWGSVKSAYESVNDFGESIDTKNRNIEKTASDIHTICYTGKTAKELDLKTPDTDAFSNDLVYQNACDEYAVMYKQQMDIVYSIDVSLVSWDDLDEQGKQYAIQSIQENWGFDLYWALAWAQTDDGCILP
ncbi:MAG: RHS repeat-associated core domain-containing protein [Clostridia bacterium]|nr:RHS repeat-associated core domain-containing protein [Clostridia bacterium]